MNQPGEVYSGVPEFALHPNREVRPLVVDGRKILEYGFNLGQAMRNFNSRTDGNSIQISFESGNSKYEFSNIDKKTAKGFEDWLNGAIQISEYGPEVAAVIGGAGALYLGYKTLPITSRREFIRNGLKILKMGALGAGAGFLAGCTTEEATAQIAATLGLEGTSEATTATAIASGQIQPTETPQVFQTATGFVQVSQTPEGQITVTASPTPTLNPTETPTPTLTITPTATEILTPTFTYTSPHTKETNGGKFEWDPNLWFYREEFPNIGSISLETDDMIKYQIADKENLQPTDPWWLELVLVGPYIKAPWQVEMPVIIGDKLETNLLSIFNDTPHHHPGSESDKFYSIAAGLDMDSYGRVTLLNGQPYGRGYHIAHPTDLILKPGEYYPFQISCDRDGKVKFSVAGTDYGEGEINKIPKEELDNGGLGVALIHGGMHGGPIKHSIWVKNGPIKITSFT